MAGFFIVKSAVASLKKWGKWKKRKKVGRKSQSRWLMAGG
jgi:hypothetical protein